LAEIQREVGKQYDPQVAAALLELAAAGQLDAPPEDLSQEAA
jgi:hypothetical protein